MSPTEIGDSFHYIPVKMASRIFTVRYYGMSDFLRGDGIINAEIFYIWGNEHMKSQIAMLNELKKNGVISDVNSVFFIKISNEPNNEFMEIRRYQDDFIKDLTGENEKFLKELLSFYFLSETNKYDYFEKYKKHMIIYNYMKLGTLEEILNQ